MRESRSVVITGASRGLGLRARPCTCTAWVDGRRPPCDRRRRDSSACASAPVPDPDDSTLVGVPLDLDDSASIAAAAKTIDDSGRRAGRRGAQRRGRRRSAASRRCPIERVGADVLDQLLRPGAAHEGAAAVDAGRGTGRIVVVSSAGRRPWHARRSAPTRRRRARRAVGGVAVRRDRAVRPGRHVLVAGTFKTDIITEAGTSDHRDFNGPYAVFTETIDRRGRRCNASPGRLAAAVRRRTRQATRRPVAVRPALGWADARMLLFGHRLLPSRVFHHVASGWRCAYLLAVRCDPPPSKEATIMADTARSASSHGC